MATLRANPNPKSRRETGDDVLSRAKSAGAAAVKRQLTAFSTLHAAFLKADAAVARADLAARARQAKVAEADALHDARVEALARAAIGEGAPRTKPFGPWKGPTPSELREGGAEAGARASAKLAKTITSDRGAGPETKAAAARLDKAAQGVLAAQEPVAAALDKRRAAIAQREALEPAWEKAFAVLKRAARAADDDSGGGLFQALFQATRAPKRPSKKPQPTS